MGRLRVIEFDDSPEVQRAAFVVRIPSGITNWLDLLICIQRLACFPGYFGRNLNAFLDCISDFHWVESFEVVFLHADLPRMAAEDVRDYLEILGEGIKGLEGSGDHRFRVIFPERFRAQAIALFES